MAVLTFLECDACQMRASEEDIMTMTEASWIQVSPVTNEKAMRRVVDLASRGANVNSMLDRALLCSLGCLINWASSRQGIRELDLGKDIEGLL